MAPVQCGAIILAAGEGRRFGGGKLSASLEGIPILQHVLDALAAAAIEAPIVVIGDGLATAGLSAEATGTQINWRTARRVINPEPARGLASSLQLGWAAAMDGDQSPEAILVVLGDQPSIDPALIRRLAAEPLDPARPILVIRFPDGTRHPVRLELGAAPLVAATRDDRGLGPLIDENPGLVRFLDVAGTNPDIDSRDDLVELIAANWAKRVRDDAEQVDRFREAPDGRDFYATVSRTFVADPGRADDPVLTALLDLAHPADTWLDVGAGAGRYALPLAQRVREVLAVDPSTSMLETLGSGMDAHGISNIRRLAGRWPPDRELRRQIGSDPVADAALIAHVSYDIAEVVPFMEALEHTASRRCVAILMDHSPASVAAAFWPLVHGEGRVALPAAPEFIELLHARGVSPSVTWHAGERRRWADRDELLGFLRRHLWIAPGSEADGRLIEAVAALVREAADGSIEVSGGPTLNIALISWPGVGISASMIGER